MPPCPAGSTLTTERAPSHIRILLLSVVCARHEDLLDLDSLVMKHLKPHFVSLEVDPCRLDAGAAGRRKMRLVLKGLAVLPSICLLPCFKRVQVKIDSGWCVRVKNHVLTGFAVGHPLRAITKIRAHQAKAPSRRYIHGD